MCKDFVHLIASQHDWDALGLFCPLDVFNPAHLLFEDLLVKKQDRAEGLILGRGRHVTNSRQVRKKLCDLGCAHLVRMTQMMKPDKALDPVAIRSFRSQTVVFKAQNVERLVEKFFRLACDVSRGYD